MHAMTFISTALASVAYFPLPSTHATPTFEGCSAEQQDQLLGAVRDSRLLSSIAVSTLELAQSGHARPASAPMKGNEVDAIALTVRWFGDEVFTGGNADGKHVDYLKGLYTCLANAVDTNTMKYRCGQCEDPKTLAYSEMYIDPKTRTVWSGPDARNVTFCFGSMHANAFSTTWDDAVEIWKALPREERVRKAAWEHSSGGAVLLHEVTHLLGVSKPKIIQDVCVPWNRSWPTPNPPNKDEVPFNFETSSSGKRALFAYTPYASQLLALQPTTLAIHRAANFAGFAAEAAITAYDRLPPASNAFQTKWDNEMTREEIKSSIPKKQIKMLEAGLEEIVGYRVVEVEKGWVPSTENVEAWERFEEACWF